MSVSFEYIAAKITGLWPGCMDQPKPRMTSDLILEIEQGCESWTEADFDDAVNRFRQNDKAYRFPPTWRELKNYAIKREAKGSLWFHFINNVTLFGWEQALHDAFEGNSGLDFEQGQKIREILNQAAIHRDTHPYGYGAFPEHLVRFWEILHLDGTPGAAFTYLGNKLNSARYRRQGEFLSGLDLSDQQKYFPCLRHRANEIQVIIEDNNQPQLTGENYNG